MQRVVQSRGKARRQTSDNGSGVHVGAEAAQVMSEGSDQAEGIAGGFEV